MLFYLLVVAVVMHNGSCRGNNLDQSHYDTTYVNGEDIALFYNETKASILRQKGRRRLKDEKNTDKQNDNNNGNANAKADIDSEEKPSKINPTSSPSLKFILPAVKAPSPSPSQPPVSAEDDETENVSRVMVQFSFMMSEESKKLDAQYLRTERENNPLLDLLQTVTRLLCEVTEFNIVTINNLKRDVCVSFTSGAGQRRTSATSTIAKDTDSPDVTRFLQNGVDYNDPKSTVLSLDTMNPIYEIHDRELLNHSYIELTLMYDLVKTGEYYYFYSDINLGIESPEELVEKKAQDEITTSIVTGSFNKFLQDYDENKQIRVVAVVGDEADVFAPYVLYNDNVYAADDDYDSDDNSTRRNVTQVVYTIEPLHTIRVAGFLALALSTFISGVLYTSGRRRYLVRRAIRKRMLEKGDTIGLSDENAVTAMLNTGRKKAAIVKKKGDRKTPPVSNGNNSSWELMIGNEPVFIT